MDRSELCQKVEAAFPDRMSPGRLTLREGNQIDISYTVTSPCPPTARFKDWRAIPDAYLEAHHWGLRYLDRESWLFQLPRFMTYSLLHAADDGSLVVGETISNLRPPDTPEPHLRALSAQQKDVARSFLEFLAFDPTSAHQSDAIQALEEYWIENPLYPDPQPNR
jgi:hypothetical protein